jgi:hypothetical protein
MSEDPLKDIQTELSALITADSYFSGIPILTEARGDILNQLQRALGKLGIVVIIETLTGKPEHASAGSYTVELSLGITVTENVLINQSASGTRKPASAVVARIMCLLNPLRQQELPAWIESFGLVDDSGGLLIYQLNCKAVAGFTLQETTP